MNTYEITFTRENGSTGKDRITAANEKQARKDFREIYRHSSATITDVIVAAENVPASKQQERDALDQIRAIVDTLGPDSYLATAFAGCFEDAEENIKNDFACSMKQRLESAEAKRIEAELGYNRLVDKLAESEKALEAARADIEKMVTDYYPGYESMLKKMDDDTLFEYIEKMIGEQVKEQYGIQMENMYSYLSDSTLAHDFGLLSLEDDDYLWLYENAMPPVYSTSTLKDNLKKLGYVDLDSPSKINIYASTFEDKDAIADAIERYNDSVSEDDKIEYTDIVALLMSSISTIINVISYVLIAFVAISLVVSSIMIGIITYISVLERTKEIGILRAIGASKHDIARVFNAETLIEGLIAGLLGVGLTLVLILPINAVVQHLTDIASLGAKLPWQAGAALVAISMLLTFLAGLIPSSLAAKKDPVVALRTE